MTSDDQGPDSEPVDLTPLASLRLDPARRSALAARIGAAAAAGLLSLGTTEQSLAGGSAADPTWVIEQRAPTDADLAQAIGLETGTQESE